MKIRHKNKTYEYPTTTMLVNIETRDKIKVQASKNGMPIKDFVEKLITEYENTSNSSIR